MPIMFIAMRNNQCSKVDATTYANELKCPKVRVQRSAERADFTPRETTKTEKAKFHATTKEY